MNYRQFNNLQLPPTSNYAPAPPPPYSYYPPANAGGGSSPTRQTRARSSHRTARTPVVYPPRRAVTPSYSAYPPSTLQTRYDAVAPAHSAQYGAQSPYHPYASTPAPTVYNPYHSPPRAQAQNTDWSGHAAPFTPHRNPSTLAPEGAWDQRYAGESRGQNGIQRRASKPPKVRDESRYRSDFRSPPPALRKPSLPSSMASTTTLRSGSWHSSTDTLQALRSGHDNDHKRARVGAQKGQGTERYASSEEAYVSSRVHAYDVRSR